MFDHKSYVPILRWKQAERFALRDLADDVRNRITPLASSASSRKHRYRQKDTFDSPGLPKGGQGNEGMLGNEAPIGRSPPY
jgi:Beta protein